MKRFALLLGLVLLGVGLLLGFLPVTAGGVDCGSGFVASNKGDVADFATVLGGGSLRDATHAAECKDAVSGRRTVALALALPGVVVAYGGVVMLRRPEEKSA